MMEMHERCFPYLEQIVFVSKGVELVVEAVEHIHHMHRLINSFVGTTYHTR